MRTTRPSIPTHDRSPAGFLRAAWAVLGLTLAVVIWGAYVRASFSGAGCGDHWPLCNGVVVPPSPSFETIVELTHRVTSGLALIGALGLYVLARRHHPPGHRVRRAAGAGAVFMVTEALVGAGLVLFRMVADSVSEARGIWISLHLVNTFLLLGCQAATVRFAQGVAAPRRLARSERFLVGALLGGLLLVGMSGAIAALGDTLFPLGSFREALAEDFSPSAHLFVRLRIYHPGLAIGVGALLVGTAWMLARTRPDPRVQYLALATTFLYAGQLALGALNVWLRAPVWLQLVHLGLADALWLTTCWMLLTAYEQRSAAADLVRAGALDVDVLGGQTPSPELRA